MIQETNRQMFMRYVAQTSFAPLSAEIAKAEGVFMYTPDGKKIIDTVSGISVSNVGHCNPKVVQAVKEQAEKYMHLMVYGEMIQSPQVQLAKRLTEVLPENLNNVYFVNSGSEATDGSLKLAKRFTGRKEIISFKKAYHGSTIGAMSIWGSDKYNKAYKPLLPGVKRLNFNNMSDLEKITDKTACVITEVIQSEGGLNIPEIEWVKALRKRCDETGALLILDEVQMGMGRTGKMFGFENFGIVPDIVNLAKALGGGMPIGAFVADKKIMEAFCEPPLGHITTFGGHPVSAAAALASLNFIIDEKLPEKATAKGEYFETLIKDHPKVKRTWGIGLFRGIEVDKKVDMWKFLHKALENGVLSDLFIFRDHAFRFTPPLTITNEEIVYAVNLLKKTLDEV
ncbi:MAG: aspartate aminotransferase family protein [Bacteroidales bacterium]|nr:aspartate aminotransferase family protein [Bacteroidales bacterium]MBR6279576.1 aspartate aminotransferase family protein [Bacteroidales bacterium]